MTSEEWAILGERAVLFVCCAALVAYFTGVFV